VVQHAAWAIPEFAESPDKDTIMKKRITPLQWLFLIVVVVLVVWWIYDSILTGTPIF
jgi:hypothetical protein